MVTSALSRPRLQIRLERCPIWLDCWWLSTLLIWDSGGGNRTKGRKRSRSSLRDKIKFERSFVLNVIAEAPLRIVDCRRVNPSWMILLLHCDRIRANRLIGRHEFIDDIVA